MYLYAIMISLLSVNLRVAAKSLEPYTFVLHLFHHKAAHFIYSLLAVLNIMTEVVANQVISGVL